MGFLNSTGFARTQCQQSGNAQSESAFCTQSTKSTHPTITLHELVNEIFEPWKQVNEKHANMPSQAFILATGGPDQAHIGTGGGGSSSKLPWRDKDKDKRPKRGLHG